MMNQKHKLIGILCLALVIGLTACTFLGGTAPDHQPVISTPLPLETLTPVPSLSITVSPGAADYLQGGLGIMGDSFYDEYQADDHRGGAYNGVTFNLVEILVHHRNFDLGPWGIWGEPRRTGYEYNWARSGATSVDLIADGQHTGLAEQVRQGKVQIVFIGIGANDFNPYYGPAYQAIYSGEMNDTQLAEKVENAIANVTLAVDTVQQAGAKQIVVTYFVQFYIDPILSESFPDLKGRLRVAKAVDAVNVGIQAMGKEKGVVVIDQNSLGSELLLNLEENRYLNVGGERIDFVECADEPHYSRLADKQHIGTVTSGVSANLYFIQPFNKHFGTNIPPLSDEEIIKIAGIR